jgi:hypothetical protein
MGSFNFIKLEVDKKTIDDVKNMLSAVLGGAEKAIIRAANDTAVTARSRIVDTVYSRLNLKKTRIRDNTNVFKTNDAKRGATAVIYNQPVRLIEYPYIPSIVGLSVHMRRDAGAELFRHRFEATMPSGHFDLFERSIRQGKPVGRLPIDKTYGLSIGKTFHFYDEKKLVEEMATLFQQRVLDRAIYILSRA